MARMRKYGESKMTRIMMASVPHVTSGLGLNALKQQFSSIVFQIDVYTLFIK